STGVKIEGVKHQFSTLSGLKEDIVEFILNLKKVRLKVFEDKSVNLALNIKGPKEIYASDIKTGTGAEIINKDLYLGTLADKSVLEAELTAENGYGYSLSEERKNNTIGVIVIDAYYSPVTRVNYKVEATRVGRMTNLDKLILEVTTDGTIEPEEAVKQAAKILASYFMQVIEPKAADEETNVAVTPKISDDILKMTVEELDLPTRITNSLKNGGIETVGQLLGTPRKELLKIKNLGGKSLSSVEEKLREKGVALSV
ncbi:MAG: DNA-directed RNA polymerase subunit alpha, partial [Patescibacteria group bacterium]|nr:DNA-directed RNA polymerase subunit alpha [Patescibacteria group bacterium]